MRTLDMTMKRDFIEKKSVEIAKPVVRETVDVVLTIAGVICACFFAQFLSSTGINLFS